MSDISGNRTHAAICQQHGCPTANQDKLVQAVWDDAGPNRNTGSDPAWRLRCYRHSGSSLKGSCLLYRLNMSDPAVEPRGPRALPRQYSI